MIISFHRTDKSLVFFLRKLPSLRIHLKVCYISRERLAFFICWKQHLVECHADSQDSKQTHSTSDVKRGFLLCTEIFSNIDEDLLQTFKISHEFIHDAHAQICMHVSHNNDWVSIMYKKAISHYTSKLNVWEQQIWKICHQNHTINVLRVCVCAVYWFRIC